MGLFETRLISTLGSSQGHGQSRTSSHLGIRESIPNVDSIFWHTGIYVRCALKYDLIEGVC